MWGMIQELVDAGTTVMLTTQYLEEADRLADRIGVIDHGRLISEGTAGELKAKLAGDVIDIVVSADQRDRTARVLEEVVGDDAVWDEATLRFTIPAADGVRTLTEVVRRLDQADVIPEDLGLHRPSLDDVFLSLTGHSAEGDPSVAEAGTDQLDERSAR
jgi:ABC-2 type transport system ATP-binding protein